MRNNYEIGKLLRHAKNLSHLTVKTDSGTVFSPEHYCKKSSIDIQVKNERKKCYIIQGKPSSKNCSTTCQFKHHKTCPPGNETFCICELHSCVDHLTPTTTTKNGGIPMGLRTKKERHKNSFAYCIVIAIFSLITLLTNFFTLAKMCSCREQTVTKIFIMSLLLFNVLLAEYGIALAAYVSQEDGSWDANFCSGMTAVKIFAMAATVFCLFLLALQRAINPPADPHYNKQEQRFKAIVYVLELLVVGAMCCIMAWTKFDNWDYLCSIWQPVMTVDRLLVGIEMSYYVFLFLVLIRYPYRKVRVYFERKKEDAAFEKKKKKDERNFPVFMIVSITLTIWVIPYIITSPKYQIATLYSAPVVRLCALLFAAALHPPLFVYRHSFIFNKGCVATKADVEEGLDQCECHGMQTCRYCEEKEMISRCDTYRFTDRRKSLSMDSLPRVSKDKAKAKENKKQKVKHVSKSFPLIDMSTIEESHIEDTEEIHRLLLEKGTVTADATPNRTRSTSMKKESTISLPLLSSPLRHIFPGRKISCQGKINSKQAKLSPEKQLSLDAKTSPTSPRGREKSESSASDRSTTSTPVKSDNETDALLGPEGKSKSFKTKRKKKEKGKSKESLNSCTSPKQRLSVPGSRDSSCPTSPKDKDAPAFRVSRVPSFIPLSDAASCGSPAKKKLSASKAPSTTQSPIKKPPPPGKESKEIKPDILTTKLPSNIQGIDARAVKAPRGADRRKEWFMGKKQPEAEEQADGQVTKQPEKQSENQSEKPSQKQPERKQPERDPEQKPRKRRKKPRRKGDPKYQEFPVEQTDKIDVRHGSNDSLEWDPSYSLSDSSPSPVDEFCPPTPAPPPGSSTSVPKSQNEGEVRQSTVSNVSAGQSSVYSMDWDNTNLQLRNSVASQCDWEPYSVDEQKSSGESRETSPKKLDQPVTRLDEITSPMRTDVVVVDGASPTGSEVDTIKETKTSIQP